MNNSLSQEKISAMIVEAATAALRVLEKLDSPEAVHAASRCRAVENLLHKATPREVLLTARDAAKILGVSHRSVQLACDNKLIDVCYTPGGHRRIRQEDVLKFRESSVREAKLRIEWDVNGEKGHGPWAPIDRKHALQEYVRELNDKFGAGTHWLNQVAQRLPRSTDANLLKKEA